MDRGGPHRVKQRGPEALLPAQGRGRVPVPMAPSLPLPHAGPPSKEEQHEGLRERRRAARLERERKQREKEARRVGR